MKTLRTTKLCLALVLGYFIATTFSINVLAQEAYWSSTYPFVITPPSGWTIKEWSWIPEEVRFELYGRIIDRVVAAVCVIVKTPRAGVLLTMRDFISSLKEDLRSSLKGFDLKQEQDVKVGGIDGYELVFTWSTRLEWSPTGKAKLVVLLRTDKAYTILYATSERNYNKYLADADRSINSFRFTEKLTFDAEPRIASITVDQKTYSRNDLPKAIFFLPEETHTVTVESTIPGPTGTRYLFLEWSDGNKETFRAITVTKSETYTARYKTQYELIVKSEHGIPHGAGWYDAGTEASFTVTSPIPESGFMGIIGAKIVFDHWSGDSSASTPTATIKMDGPKAVTAIWKADYTQAYITLGAVLVVLAILAVAVVMRRRGSSSISSGI